MSKEEIIAKLSELADNAEFEEAVTNAETVEEMIDVMAGYGIQITVRELGEIMATVTGELDEDSLEDVAGGYIRPVDPRTLKKIWEKGLLYKGYKIGEISCPTKYFPEASSINFMRSCKYGLEVLLVSIKYRLAKMKFPINLFNRSGHVLDSEKELVYYNEQDR